MTKPPVEDALIGIMIDRKYRIEEQIGSGGMGVVYRAVHVFVGQPRAIKVMKLELDDDDYRRRFLAEPQLAAEIEHPNIIPVYDAGEEAGRPYVVMAFIDGTDLQAKLKGEGNLKADEALEICSQVAAALDAAHARGLVHRDVKPANILIRNDGHVFLCDFGVAKDKASKGGTRRGLFVGTLEYASPEQVEQEKLDGRSDQYALACVLYECLSGETPFEPISDMKLADAHRKQPPPAISAHGLPAGLDAVIKKGMAKNPSGRYTTCTEFVAAAQAVIAEESRRPTKLAVPGQTRIDPSTQEPGETRLDKDLTRLDDETTASGTRRVALPRKPVLIGLIVAAVLLAAGSIIAAVLLGGGDGPAQTAPPPRPGTVTETVSEPVTTTTPVTPTFPAPGAETTLYEAIPGRTRAHCAHGGFNAVRGAIAALDCHVPNGNWLTYGMYGTGRGALSDYNRILKNYGLMTPGVAKGDCPSNVDSNQEWQDNSGWVACWLASHNQPNVLSVDTKQKIVTWGARTPAGASMAELWAYFYNYGNPT